MIRKILFLLILLFFSVDLCRAQGVVKTSDLFTRNDENPGMGYLNINQDPGVDSLISKYILINKKLNGMEGFRIQIYSSSNRNAREESGKTRAEFINKFPETKYPDLVSYAPFAAPGYYKIRVGNFRTKTEATKSLLMIRRVFPEAYLVPDIIRFPDLNKK